MAGISTGGPSTLRKIFSTIKSIRIPIVIAQHMPTGFTEGLVEGLNVISNIPVIEAQDGMELENKIYIGKSGFHIVFDKNKRKILRLVTEPKDAHFFPLADVLFKSAAEEYGCKTISLVMTGLSAYSDGVAGTKAVAGTGGLTLVQEARCCVAPGMPTRSLKEGDVKSIINIEEIEMLFTDWEVFYKYMINKCPDNKNINILVVDDHPSHKYMIKEILEGEGYNVDVASDGLKAIEMATMKKYEVVLMDIRMPNMDGVAATEALYQIDPMQKVIIVTASLSEKTKKRIEMLEVFDYVYKPIEVQKIIDVVKRAVKAYYL